MKYGSIQLRWGALPQLADVFHRRPGKPGSRYLIDQVGLSLLIVERLRLVGIQDTVTELQHVARRYRPDSDAINTPLAPGRPNMQVAIPVDVKF